MARRKNLSGGFAPGILDDEAFFHTATLAGRYANERGAVLGLDEEGVPRLFDAAWLRILKKITAPSIMITGDVGTGKSTFAERIGTLSWMMNVRGGERVRMEANITKAGDHGDWVRMLGGTVIDLKGRFKDGINIFDPKLPLETEDRAETLTMFARDTSGAELSAGQQNLLTAGLTAVIAEEQFGEPHITKLNDWLNTVTYDEYARLQHVLGTISDDVMPRISQARIDELSGGLSDIVSNIISGSHGKILGGHGSLADMLTPDIVSFDFTHLTPEAQPLVQTFLWQVKGAAVRRGDKRYITDVEIIDENMEYWYSYSMAKTLQSRVKKLRSTGQLLIFVTQHYSDYLSIPGEQGKLATNMLTDIGSHFVGHHEDEDNIGLIMKYAKLQRTEANGAHLLGPGHFWCKIGQLPAYILQSPHIGFMPDVADTDRASRLNLALEAIS